MSLNFACVPRDLLDGAKEDPALAWEVLELAKITREQAWKVASFEIERGDHVRGLSYTSNPFDIDINRAA